MVHFDLNTWLVLVLVAAACVTGILYTLATHYRNETNLQDLRVQVHALRHAFAERLRLEREDEVVEVDVLEDLPGVSPVEAPQQPPARKAA